MMIVSCTGTILIFNQTVKKSLKFKAKTAGNDVGSRFCRKSDFFTVHSGLFHSKSMDNSSAENNLRYAQ